MHGKHRRRRSIAFLAVLIAGAGMVLATAGMAFSQSEPSVTREDADLVVSKRANCTCCEKWVAHL